MSVLNLSINPRTSGQSRSLPLVGIASIAVIVDTDISGDGATTTTILSIRRDGAAEADRIPISLDVAAQLIARHTEASAA